MRALERNFDLYMAHHFAPGLPAANNITENVIKQLNKKVRLIEGFESIESAEHYVRVLVGRSPAQYQATPGHVTTPQKAGVSGENEHFCS